MPGIEDEVEDKMTRESISKGGEEVEHLQVRCFVEVGLPPLIQFKATSPASSLALLRFLPSYQNRAERDLPQTVTPLDQAVWPSGIWENFME